MNDAEHVVDQARRFYDVYLKWADEQEKFDMHNDSFGGLDNLRALRARMESETGLLGLSLYTHDRNLGASA